MISYIKSIGIFQNIWRIKLSKRANRKRSKAILGKEIDEIPEPPKLPYLKEFNCVSSPTFKRRSMSLNQNQLEKLKELSKKLMLLYL